MRFSLRPVLRGDAAVQEVLCRGRWLLGKVWAVCGKSATLAWSYILVGIARWCSSSIPWRAAARRSRPQESVTNTLQADPKILGYVMMAISAITIASAAALNYQRLMMCRHIGFIGGPVIGPVGCI